MSDDRPRPAGVPGLILPKYAALQESVRYKSQEYFGWNVRVDKMSDQNGAVMMSLKSQYSEKSLKRWRARKNKNPLRTRMTVKQLKNLISTINKDSTKTPNPAIHLIAQKGQFMEEAVAVDGPEQLDREEPVHSSPNDAGDRAYDSGLLATAMHLSCLDTPRTLALGSDANSAAPASELEQAAATEAGGDVVEDSSKTKLSRRAPRPRSFDVELIEIGSFNVMHIAGTPEHKLKVNFSQQCIIYEFQCDCLVQENAWTPPDLVHVTGTIVVPFEIIKSMCFLEFELWMRLKKSPTLSCGVDSPSESTRRLIQDVTGGQKDLCLVHRVVLKQKKGATLYGKLMEFNAALFLPLQSDLLSVLEEPAESESAAGVLMQLQPMQPQEAAELPSDGVDFLFPLDVCQPTELPFPPEQL